MCIRDRSRLIPHRRTSIADVQLHAGPVTHVSFAYNNNNIFMTGCYLRIMDFGRPNKFGQIKSILVNQVLGATALYNRDASPRI